MKIQYKTILAILICSIYITACQLVAQTDIINQLKEAITNASANKLSKLFAEQIEISFEGEKTDYSRTQAEFVMKDFFQKNPPKSFSIVHQGNSKNSKYSIGEYIAKTQTFRFYLLIKDFKGNMLINSLDISKK